MILDRESDNNAKKKRYDTRRRSVDMRDCMRDCNFLTISSPSLSSVRPARSPPDHPYCAVNQFYDNGLPDKLIYAARTSVVLTLLSAATIVRAQRARAFSLPYLPLTLSLSLTPATFIDAKWKHARVLPQSRM